MLTRRNLVRLAAGGPAFTGLRVPAASGQGLGIDYDVIVVGAGVAGLTVADHLLNLDDELKVLVLEARDRIGGRVYSVPRDDMYQDAELGAQYLPGDVGASWEPLARFGLDATAQNDTRLKLTAGMSAFTRGLAQAAEGRIQLSSEVSEVFWREGLAGVYYQNRGLRSAVTTRRLVLAIPAGVLRQDVIKITPTLSSAKMQALQAMTAEPYLSCALLMPADQGQLASGQANWHRDDLGVHLRASKSGINGELLLEAHYWGVRADALASEDESLVLRLALQDFTPALITQPVLEDAIWTQYVDWSSEAYSRGAITSPGTTSEHLALAESIGDTLFFAGDAACDPSLAGSLQGAYDSGIRAAREIAVSLALGEQEEGAEPILELL